MCYMIVNKKTGNIAVKSNSKMIIDELAKSFPASMYVVKKNG